MPRLTTFTRDGLVFNVDDTGPLDGPPVVLLHGFPTDRTSWQGISALLHDAGLRTLNNRARNLAAFRAKAGLKEGAARTRYLSSQEEAACLLAAPPGARDAIAFARYRIAQGGTVLTPAERYRPCPEPDHGAC